jgi:hypothetical protein
MMTSLATRIHARFETASAGVSYTTAIAIQNLDRIVTIERTEAGFAYRAIKGELFHHVVTSTGLVRLFIFRAILIIRR